MNSDRSSSHLFQINNIHVIIYFRNFLFWRKDAMARYVKFLMGLRTSPSMSRVGVGWWHNLSECELSEVSDLAQPHYYKCSQENKCWLARCQHFLTETNRGWGTLETVGSKGRGSLCRQWDWTLDSLYKTVCALTSYVDCWSFPVHWRRCLHIMAQSFCYWSEVIFLL